MRIFWLARAECDLNALTDFILEDNPRTALRIFDIISNSVEKLETYPLLGREGRVEGTRELVIPHFPFIVVYAVTKEIRILAVLHTSRRWPSEM